MHDIKEECVNETQITSQTTYLPDGSNGETLLVYLQTSSRLKQGRTSLAEVSQLKECSGATVDIL